MPKVPAPRKLFRATLLMLVVWGSFCASGAGPVAAQQRISPRIAPGGHTPPIAPESSGRTSLNLTPSEAELPADSAGPFLTAPSIEYPEPLEPDAAQFDPDAVGPSMDNRVRWNLAPRRRQTVPPNFWVISFRDCPQRGTPRGADLTTEYSYFGADGKKTMRTADEFYASLRPDVPLCMHVHGSLMQWDQMIEEGHQTYDWLLRANPYTPFQMVFVTWPSERFVIALPMVDFPMLGRQGGFNGLYLARVLSRVPENIKVSMIGHSHGARLVVSALHLSGGGDVEGFRLPPRETPWPRMRGVLAAAAFDHHWMDPGQRYDKSLLAAESLINFRNRDDFALRLYPLRLPFGRESLGRVGFNFYDQQVLGPEYAKVRDVEVTSVLGVKHIWPWFYNQPEIGRMLAPYLFFQEDIPHQVTLKPSSRTPSNEPAYVNRRPTPGRFPLARSPRKPHPAVANSSGSGHSALPQSPRQELVRGNLDSAPSPHSQRDREITIPTQPGRARVTPSAARIFGAPTPRYSRD